MSGSHVRSDFFVTMVLADAHLRAGDVEEACRVTLDALDLGEQVRSARCVAISREFRRGLTVHAAARPSYAPWPIRRPVTGCGKRRSRAHQERG